MPSKYKNVRTSGFASKKEANRYKELCLLKVAKKISHLTTQVRFTFEPLKYDSGRVPYYVADFKYFEVDKWVVEDTKGVRTPLYKLKKALMKHFYDIEILET